MLVQERIRIPDDKMDYYKDLAEMYVGDDVSPDFYGWVFPKYDHVAVGTGTVVNKPGIKQYQQVCQQQLMQKCGVSASTSATQVNELTDFQYCQPLATAAFRCSPAAVMHRSTTISMGMQMS